MNKRKEWAYYFVFVIFFVTFHHSCPILYEIYVMEPYIISIKNNILKKSLFSENDLYRYSVLYLLDNYEQIKNKDILYCKNPEKVIEYANNAIFKPKRVFVWYSEKYLMMLLGPVLFPTLSFILKTLIK